MKIVNNPYQKQWEEYKKRRNVKLITACSLIIILPLVGVVIPIIDFNFEKKIGIQFLIILIWFILYLVTASRFNTWKCPHCNEQFFAYSFWNKSPFMISKCQNCKLPKYYGSSIYKGYLRFFDNLENKEGK